MVTSRLSIIKQKLPTDLSLITTYRCQMRCQMCNIWKYPTKFGQEIKARDLEILPKLKIANITGGEPFLRDDLEDLIEVVSGRAKRIVISTSGWHEQRLIKMAERYPNLGFRISIEGLSVKNDELRGRRGGFDRAIRTLLTLGEMGNKDIGFGITVSDQNSKDMIWLYKLAKKMKLEFATATFHNSFYFHKDDNAIQNKKEVVNNFQKIIEYLLKENNPKSWYRAFFNLGLINYIEGGRRMLPCQAGSSNFFIEPYGDVYPCNGLEAHIWKESMGNIFDYSCFDDLWFSDQAEKVRCLVKKCPKNCWMIGTASPVMKKYIKHPTKWVFKNKVKSLLGKCICLDKFPYYDVGQNPLQGDLNFKRVSLCNDQHKMTDIEDLPEVARR